MRGVGVAQRWMRPGEGVRGPLGTRAEDGTRAGRRRGQDQPRGVAGIGTGLGRRIPQRPGRLPRGRFRRGAPAIGLLAGDLHLESGPGRTELGAVGPGRRLNLARRGGCLASLRRGSPSRSGRGWAGSRRFDAMQAAQIDRMRVVVLLTLDLAFRLRCRGAQAPVLGQQRSAVVDRGEDTARLARIGVGKPIGLILLRSELAFRLRR